MVQYVKKYIIRIKEDVVMNFNRKNSPIPKDLCANLSLNRRLRDLRINDSAYSINYMQLKFFANDFKIPIKDNTVYNAIGYCFNELSETEKKYILFYYRYINDVLNTAKEIEKEFGIELTKKETREAKTSTQITDALKKLKENSINYILKVYLMTESDREKVMNEIIGTDPLLILKNVE